MSVRIAVRDPLPLFQRGMMSTLEDMGLVAEAPGDLLAWSRQGIQQVVFLTLQSSADWQLLAEMCQASSGPIVVAVLVDASVPAYLQALSSGAATAVPRDASPERLREVLRAVVQGMTLLPTDVVQALGRSRTLFEKVEQAPPDRELSWLHELARGVTVAQLAEQAGYSERTMYRLLQNLYRRMGVRKRTEALILAHEHGWL